MLSTVLFLFFLTDWSFLHQHPKTHSQIMLQRLKPRALSRALWKELAQSVPWGHPHPSGPGWSEVCESPCLRQPSQQVTAVVLLGALLGKAFQVPSGELLLRENNDYFREVFSVNNIPQVSVFPAPITASFDDGSSFQDQKPLLLKAGKPGEPQVPALVFSDALGAQRMPAQMAYLVLSLSPQILPTTQHQLCFTEN